MARKTVKDLSSDELFEMARVRELEEHAAEKEAVKETISALRTERKQTQSRHRKELAEIDAQIRALGGRTGGGRRGARGGQTGLSGAVLDILGSRKKATTKFIREQLDGMGMNTANLGQTLAYLKRTGRVSSEERGVYSRT